MTLIPLPPGHNDTTECFKRHSKVFFSDQFLTQPSAEARRLRKHTWWLIAYLVAVFLAIVLIPTPKAESLSVEAVGPAMPFSVGDNVHLNAFKACPPGLAPLWIDSTTIQCFRELPNE